MSILSLVEDGAVEATWGKVGMDVSEVLPVEVETKRLLFSAEGGALLLVWAFEALLDGEIIEVVAVLAAELLASSSESSLVKPFTEASFP